eukprot:scaffold11726_cov16-Tisochrysis_lutea.AAC.1
MVWTSSACRLQAARVPGHTPSFGCKSKGTNACMNKKALPIRQRGSSFYWTEWNAPVFQQPLCNGWHLLKISHAQPMPLSALAPEYDTAIHEPNRYKLTRIMSSGAGAADVSADGGGGSGSLAVHGHPRLWSCKCKR